MTLHKTTASTIERVICNEEIDGCENLDDARFSTGIPGIYSEMRAIYTMSVKYADSVEVFTKLADSLSTISDPNIRWAMLDSITSILSEIGTLATQVFQSDDDLLKASEKVITEKIMLPTIKLRESVVKMKSENAVKPNAIDKAIHMIDHLMDAMNIRTLGIDGMTKYSVVDRDGIN